MCKGDFHRVCELWLLAPLALFYSREPHYMVTPSALLKGRRRVAGSPRRRLHRSSRCAARRSSPASSIRGGCIMSANCGCSPPWHYFIHVNPIPSRQAQTGMRVSVTYPCGWSVVGARRWCPRRGALAPPPHGGGAACGRSGAHTVGTAAAQPSCHVNRFNPAPPCASWPRRVQTAQRLGRPGT